MFKKKTEKFQIIPSTEYKEPRDKFVDAVRVLKITFGDSMCKDELKIFEKIIDFLIEREQSINLTCENTLTLKKIDQKEFENIKNMLKGGYNE